MIGKLLFFGGEIRIVMDKVGYESWLNWDTIKEK